MKSVANSLDLVTSTLRDIASDTGGILNLTAGHLTGPRPSHSRPCNRRGFRTVKTLNVTTFLNVTYFRVLADTVRHVVSNDGPMRVDAVTLIVLLIILIVGVFITCCRHQINVTLGDGVLVTSTHRALDSV